VARLFSPVQAGTVLLGLRHIRSHNRKADQTPRAQTAGSYPRLAPYPALMVAVVRARLSGQGPRTRAGGRLGSDEEGVGLRVGRIGGRRVKGGEGEVDLAGAAGCGVAAEVVLGLVHDKP
jgi:hypothetical protein